MELLIELLGGDLINHSMIWGQLQIPTYIKVDITHSHNMDISVAGL